MNHKNIETLKDHMNHQMNDTLREHMNQIKLETQS